MRFWRTKDDRVLIVGIFQSPEIGRAVLKNLHRAGFPTVAAIHALATGRPRVEKHGTPAIAAAVAASAFVMALGAFILWQREGLADHRPDLLAVLFVAVSLAGALACWSLVRLLR